MQARLPDDLASAISLLGVGSVEAADGILRHRLADADVRKLHTAASMLARAGHFEWAWRFGERAMALAPSDARVLLTASNLAQDLGNASKAIELAELAVSANPDLAEVHNNLGVLLVNAGRTDDAVQAFRRAVAARPDHVRAWINLAAATLRCGHQWEAIEAAKRATQLDASSATAWQIMGNAHIAAGETELAERALRRSLNFTPSNAEASLLLASLLMRQQRVEECVDLLRRTLSFEPTRASLWGQLGDAYAELDQGSAAAEAYTRAMQLAPHEIAWPVRLAVQLPRIPESATHIDDVRRRYETHLEVLSDRRFSPGENAEAQLNVAFQTPFYLGYQGRDDKILQRQYANLAAKAVRGVFPEYFEPRAARVRSPDSRIRIGFASRYLYSCTVGHYFASWIRSLPKDRFDVFVYTSSAFRDALSISLEAGAGGVFRKDATIGEFAKRIASDRLDILVYPEIGMDQMFYLLATMRLAPVQLAAWGHPVTPGHPNLDGFISCSSMEPIGAQAHYNEPLHLLPGIGTCYGMPVLAEKTFSRADFLLPPDKVLMLVPQSLFKIHPDNDALLIKILQHAPRVTAVMFAGQNNAITQRFVHRLLKAFSSVGLPHQGRIKILPVVDHASYRRINALCDFMLDTLHWSGGNASLDALAQGLPMVTVPGAFMRGRQSMAMLRMMGIDELIANDSADLIEKTVRLSTDAEWRYYLRERVVANRHKIFDDMKPITALAALLERIHGGDAAVRVQETSDNL